MQRVSGYLRADGVHTERGTRGIDGPAPPDALGLFRTIRRQGRFTTLLLKSLLRSRAALCHARVAGDNLAQGTWWAMCGRTRRSLQVLPHRVLPRPGRGIVHREGMPNRVRGHMLSTARCTWAAATAQRPRWCRTCALDALLAPEHGVGV